MKQNKFLSVVIPTFNGSHLISKCLNALKQDGVATEFIGIQD